MRLLDKYILKSLCRSVPIWGICFYQYFIGTGHIVLELLNILPNMGHHCSRYESFCLGITKHCYLNIPNVSFIGFSIYDL